jgi:hypothetical protein
MSTIRATHLHGSMHGYPAGSSAVPEGASLNVAPAVWERTRRFQAGPEGPAQSIVSVRRVRTVKARWVHVPPSAAPAWTDLAPAFRENLLGDVHTDVHAGRCKQR